MRLTPHLYFAGSVKDSRSPSPETETRPSTPNSVHSDASTERQITTSDQTAKKLLEQGAITQAEYELLSGGLDKAHLEIRSKINLARAWQTRSIRLDKELDKVWDDLNETEEQLAAVQQTSEEAEKHLGTMQKAYIELQRSCTHYKHQNTAMVQANSQLRHALNTIQTKQEKQAEPKKGNPEKAQRQSPLRQLALTHNEQLAQKAAKAADGQNPQ